MKIKAYAKINLTLDITGKREDGYHDLETVMQEVSLYDELDISIKKHTGGNLIGLKANIPQLPTDERNTCYKAAQRFCEQFGIKDTEIRIKLNKNIPIGAGLGGGSADAAAVLKALNKLLKVNADIISLEELAVKIGADVPFFIKGGLQLAEGIGEKLTPLRMKQNPYYVIAKPSVDALSINIYKEFDKLCSVPNPTTGSFINKIIEGAEPFEHIGNMLSAVTEAQHEKVKKIRETLQELGARSCMSGSGTAVFGIFGSYLSAMHAVNSLRESFLADFIKICLPNQQI